IKTEERIRGLDVGKKLLERALHRHNLSSTEAFKPDRMTALTKEFGIATPEDLLVAIGYGRITTEQVIRALQPAAAMKEGLADKLIRKIGIRPTGVKIKGIGDLLVHLSKCCNPVPGDSIIGFVTRGRGLSVHSVDCPNIDELDYDKDRIVEVHWDTQDATPYSVKITVLTVDRPGMLASVSAAITSAKANISHADITTTEDRRATLNFVVEILNAGHLAKVLKSVEAVDGVVQAKRVRPG
ncbi:MAG: bifunctional (p)ppGpp synthetase/guanosine-3',5'-bis(diphosphate) 3'-pyrophosphohydrolase, partial [Nitrospirae bacterium]|nr:bifunctional (p)ppGpp synthetase/guanosine-3',5'-bis(diphosphate) 3'-pyrophosphohydrolase [Nitrospirota bacterium]